MLVHTVHTYVRGYIFCSLPLSVSTRILNKHGKYVLWYNCCGWLSTVSCIAASFKLVMFSDICTYVCLFFSLCPTVPPLPPSPLFSSIRLPLVVCVPHWRPPVDPAHRQGGDRKVLWRQLEGCPSRGPVTAHQAGGTGQSWHFTVSDYPNVVHILHTPTLYMSTKVIWLVYCTCFLSLIVPGHGVVLMLKRVIALSLYVTIDDVIEAHATVYICT